MQASRGLGSEAMSGAVWTIFELPCSPSSNNSYRRPFGFRRAAQMTSISYGRN